jgi:hypothetical protein
MAGANRSGAGAVASGWVDTGTGDAAETDGIGDDEVAEATGAGVGACECWEDKTFDA